MRPTAPLTLSHLMHNLASDDERAFHELSGRNCRESSGRQAEESRDDVDAGLFRGEGLAGFGVGKVRGPGESSRCPPLHLPRRTEANAGTPPQRQAAFND